MLLEIGGCLSDNAEEQKIRQYAKLQFRFVWLYAVCTAWFSGSSGPQRQLLSEAVRHCLHLWQSQSPVAPKTDMVLAKTGPIRDYGNTPVITDLRRNPNKRILHSLNCSLRKVE